MSNVHIANPMSLSSPPSGAIVWTPSDTLEIGHPSRTNADGSVWKPHIVAVTVIADSTMKVTTNSGDEVIVFVTAGRTSMQITKVWNASLTLGGGASTVVCWY